MFEYLHRNFLCLVGFALSIIVFSSSASAETEILKFIANSFQTRVVKEENKGKETLVIIISKNQDTTSSVFSVDNPKRIVIDLMGATLKKNNDVIFEDSSIATGIRFGAHNDKARIVVDVRNKSSLPYRTTESKGELRVILESSENESHTSETEEVEIIKQPITQEIASTALPISEPEKIPSKVPTIVPTKLPTMAPTAIAEPTIALKKQEIKPEINIPVFKEDSKEKVPVNDHRQEIIDELMNDEPTVAPTKATTKAPTLTPKATVTVLMTATPAPKITATAEASVTIALNETPVSQAVKAIKFAYLEGTKPKPVIKVTLTKKSEFELQKNDDKSYTLKIKDCREFKPELKLVSFPPHDFVGFTYIQAEENKTDIDIKIGVERSKRITATPNESEIWIALADEEKIETQSLPKGGPSALTKSMSRGLR